MHFSLRPSELLLICLSVPAVLFSENNLGGIGENSTQARPNIVLIYVDDLGWSDLGCYGSEYYDTPEIDTLARNGVMFTDAYSNAPNCAPSRAAMLSGQYAGRTGVYNVGYAERGDARWRSLIPPVNSDSVPLNTQMFADVLTENGYDCAFIGKWHVGEYGEFLPSSRGFEAKHTLPEFGNAEVYSSLVITQRSRWAHFHKGPAYGNGDGAFQVIFGDPQTDPRNSNDPSFKVVNDEIVAPGTYLTDFLADEAINFLHSRKDQESPFLLVYSDFLPHAPLNAPQEWVDHYGNKPSMEGQNNPVMAAMIRKLDISVGRLMTELEGLGLLENTVVIFKSDNGGVAGYRAAGIPNADEYTSNLPLRGGKTQLYEGGIRVPLIASWPGRFAEEEICREPVIGIDLFPTFLELAGIEVDSWKAQNPGNPLDGLSIVPLMKDPAASLDRDFIAFHFPAYALDWPGPGWRCTPHGALRAGNYKIIEHFIGEDTPGDGSRLELYNVSLDPGEQHNLILELPELASELHRDLVDWRTETGALLPVKKDTGPNAVLRFADIAVADLSDSLATIIQGPQAGVLVVETDEEKYGGLITSSVITHIGDGSVSSLEEVEAALEAFRGESVEVRFQFGDSGNVKSVTVEVGDFERGRINPERFTDLQTYQPAPETEAVILAGFDRFDDPFTGDQTTDAVITYPGVSATLTVSGTNDSDWFRNNTGSNDGTFGPNLAGADNTDTTAEFGSLTTVAVDDQSGFYLDISLRNNSGTDIELASLAFDVWRDFNGSPPRWDLLVASGDLIPGYVGQTDFIDQQGGEPVTQNANNYADLSMSTLGDLPDNMLADGESVVLRLQIWESDFTLSRAGKVSIDNIAVLTSIARPDLDAPGIRIQVTGDSVPEISFFSKQGLTYQMQKSATLFPGSWNDIPGQRISGDGFVKTFTGPGSFPVADPAFYRVVVSFAPLVTAQSSL